MPVKRISLVRLPLTRGYGLEIFSFIDRQLEIRTLAGNPMLGHHIWERVEDAGMAMFDSRYYPSFEELKATLHENMMRMLRLAIAQHLVKAGMADRSIEVSSVLAPDWHEFHTPHMEGNRTTALVGIKIGEQGAYYDTLQGLILDLSFYLEDE
jgi:hypothetical protein